MPAKGRVSALSGQTAVRAHRRSDRAAARLAAQDTASWTSGYMRRTRVVDCGCALAAGLLAFEVRFDGGSNAPAAYLVLSLSLPLFWLASVALAGGYDFRFIGVGSDEFRKVVNAGVCLTAAVAILAYATKTDIARGFVVIALPSVTLFDLLARYTLRKRLHRLRSRGSCLRRVVVVGHASVAANLAAELRRETYHGLSDRPARRPKPKSRECRLSSAWAAWPRRCRGFRPTRWRCSPARR